VFISVLRHGNHDPAINAIMLRLIQAMTGLLCMADPPDVGGLPAYLPVVPRAL
jgi:hypothetical protein